MVVPARHPGPRAASEVPPHGSPHVPLRVLLVEDSEEDAVLVVRELGRGGYEPEYERVETAEGMRKALAGSSWDLVISDYHMPRFGAFEALEVYRESGIEAPFVVVSGMVGEETAVEAMRAGAHDYVMKGNLARLCATVERGLKEATERRERRRAEGELRRRGAILEAVRFAADSLLGETMGWEEGVRDVLRRLGEAAGASRVYVYESCAGEDGEVWNTQRYEWSAPGISSTQPDRSLARAIPGRAAGFGRWIELLGRGEPIYGHIRDLPESERPELRERDILSIAVVPIFVEGRWWGFIGFDECMREREWSSSEVGALGAAAGTLGAAIRRRRMEEDLRQSEERYRAVVEQATDAIYLLDTGTKCVAEANGAFLRMFGYTADELESLEVYDFVAHPRENVDDTIRRTLRERRRIVGERKYRRKDGTLVDVEVGVSVIFHGGRELICTICRDVTERRKTEEALARSENRLRTIVETEPECVKVLGENGSLLEMNPAGLSMIEADSLEQVRGKTVYDYIAPGHRKGFVDLTESVLRGESGGTLEFELVGLKGTRRWLDTHAVPLRAAGGESSGLLAITRDITERKRKDEELRESEQRFKSLAEATFEGVAITRKGKIVETNAAFATMFGYEPSEVIGMTPLDVTAPESYETVRDARASDFEEPYEAVLLRKDGTTFDAEIRGRMTRYKGRNVRVTAFRDVTERKKNEAALRESEERFRSAFDSAAVGMGLVDLEGRWFRVNKPLCDIVGYPEQELLGLTFGDITHPDDLDSDLAQVRRLVEGEIRGYQMEKRYLHKDGHVVWILLSVSLLRDDEGNPLYFISQIQDITGKKLAEDALRQSERLYRAVIEQATENIYLVDIETRRIVEANPAFRETLGYTEEVLYGMTLYDVIAADRDSIDENVRRILERGNPSVGERKYVRKDGSLVDVDVSASIVLRDGRETLVAVAHDITERKKNEEALRESQRTLSTLMSNLPGMAYRCRNDPDWTMEFVSEGCVELTGYSPADLINNRRTSYGDLVHPDDREPVWEAVQAAVGERRPFQVTYRILTASGATKWVWEQGRGIFSPEGNLLALEGFVNDQTERVRAYRLMEERVAALSRISADLALDLPVESTLDALAESVVRASTGVACSVTLLEEGTGSLHMAGSCGLPEGFKEGIEAVWQDSRMRSTWRGSRERSPTIEAVRTRRRMLAHNMRGRMLSNPLYEPVHGPLGDVAWDTVFIVPLVSRGRALGVINISYLPGEEPGEDEQVFLGAVADQAAISVENARLFANVRDKAALEERQRLARELHDSVSQALYGIALGAKTAHAALEEDQPARAAGPLDYVLSLAEAGMAEMRALIFELRPESLQSEGLVAALEKQAAALRARHRVEVETTFCVEPETTLETKEAIYRIAQEALHNTVKHARATNVGIAMTCGPERITVEISDDGAGFDVKGDFPGHLGLRSMRERAQRLGGEVLVDSAPGRGTTIRAKVPI